MNRIPSKATVILVDGVPTAVVLSKSKAKESQKLLETLLVKKAGTVKSYLVDLIK